MKRNFIKIFASCMLTLMLVGCGSSSNSSSSKTELHSGQSITLKEDTIVCSSKENEDKLLSFIREKNTSAENQILLNGQATVLKSGSKVNITSVGITTEIEVNGKKWYAPMECFQ